MILDGKTSKLVTNDLSYAFKLFNSRSNNFATMHACKTDLHTIFLVQM